MGGFILFLYSLALIAEGAVMILSPKKMVKFVNNLLKAKDLRPLGIIPLVVGILLLFSASSSAVGWLIILFGLGGIAKAVYVFLTPAEKIKSLKWFSLPDNTHRAIGIVVLVLGVLIFISRI